MSDTRAAYEMSPKFGDFLPVPGPQDKHLTGNGEKLTYSCPAHCVFEARVGNGWIQLQQTTYTTGLFRLYPIPLYTLFS